MKVSFFTSYGISILCILFSTDEIQNILVSRSKISFSVISEAHPFFFSITAELSYVKIGCITFFANHERHSRFPIVSFVT